MHTWVYKGNKKPNTYLYIDRKDDFDHVPSALLNLLGDLNFVLDVALDLKSSLALADINDVKNQLSKQGYFLQLPPGDSKPERIC
jgi:uncharacterized protein YcgL (UPF0745 family)